MLSQKTHLLAACRPEAFMEGVKITPVQVQTDVSARARFAA